MFAFRGFGTRETAKAVSDFSLRRARGMQHDQRVLGYYRGWKTETVTNNPTPTT
jgi:hypothetical protein